MTKPVEIQKSLDLENVYNVLIDIDSVKRYGRREKYCKLSCAKPRVITKVIYKSKREGEKIDR